MPQASWKTIWTRDFTLLSASALLIWSSFHLLLPILPLYLTSRLGATPSQVGLFSSLMTVSAIVSRLLAGYLMDRTGRRWILLASLALCIGVPVLYAVATGLMVFALIRLLHGVPVGATTTASQTVAADLVPPAQRGEGIGYFSLAETLAISLGPTLALQLLGNEGFTRIYLLAGLLAFCAWLLALSVRCPNVQEPSRAFTWSSLLEPRVGWLAVAAALCCAGMGALLSFVPLYAVEQEIGGSGWFFLAYGLGLLLARSVSGRLFDQVGPKPALAVALVSMMAGYLILGLLRTELGVMAAALTVGLGFGSLTPAVFAMAANLVPPNRRGASNATVFAAFDLGFGAGSYVYGAVAQVAGNYATMYQIVALSMAAPAALFLLKVLPHYARHVPGLPSPQPAQNE